MTRVISLTLKATLDSLPRSGTTRAIGRDRLIAGILPLRGAAIVSSGNKVLAVIRQNRIKTRCNQK